MYLLEERAALFTMLLCLHLYFERYLQSILRFLWKHEILIQFIFSEEDNIDVMTRLYPVCSRWCKTWNQFKNNIQFFIL